MLIPFSEICRQLNLRPRGVLHVGAHLGEEAQDYVRECVKNVAWIEAQPSLILQLQKSVPDHHKIICAAVSDVAGQTLPFFITNNGMSSSLLSLGTHTKHHPTVVVTEEISVKTTTLTDVFRDHKLDPQAYDFINLDIQGSELSALKGISDEIWLNITHVYTEVNTEEVYVGGALIGDIDAFLNTKDFMRVACVMTEFKWGDALYIKKPRFPLSFNWDNCKMSENGEERVCDTLIPHDDDAIVFDVGANKGEWAFTVRKLHPHAKIFSFEPQASFKPLLLQHTPHVFTVALSDATGMSDFYVYSNTELSGFSERPVISNLLNEKVQVPTMTLDNFLNEHNINRIHFLKIDTEGAERRVLEGARDALLHKKINVLQFEYGGTYKDSGDTLFGVYMMLRGLDYYVYHVLPDRLLYMPEWDHRFETYCYSNFIAMATPSPTFL